MVGVVIGVGSVALLVSIGQGVKKEVTDQIQGLGANLVFIVPGKLDKNSQPNPLALLGVSTLTRQDLDALRTSRRPQSHSPFMFVAGTVEHERQPFSAFVVATAAAWAEIRPKPMAEGRFFTKAEETENICVLAHQPRAILGRMPALGKTVAVQGVPFRVIGILPDEQASALFGGGGFENMIFLPDGAAQKQIPDVQINRIVLQTIPAGDAPEQVLGDIERMMRVTTTEGARISES